MKSGFFVVSNFYIFLKTFAMVLFLGASVSDIRKKSISIIFPGAALILSAAGFLYRSFESGFCFGELFLSALPGIVMILISYLSRQGIGIGDGLMVMAIGPLLGTMETCLAVMVAFFAAAVFSMVLLIFKAANRRKTFAFLPFLTLGLGVSLYGAF